MPAEYDATEFIDGDFHQQKTPYSAPVTGAGQPARAPTREEVDTRMVEAQQKLAELKKAQEELERERATLEETRRRQIECQTGRQEMLQHLTRAVGLLQEAEFEARRDAEQMAKALVDLRAALAQVEAIHEAGWTRETFQVELTRALTALENARMEWNSARLKFPVLSAKPAGPEAPAAAASPAASLLGSYSYGDFCRLGFALTWPVALVLVGVVVMLLLRR
jgi:hypothetical protein